MKYKLTIIIPTYNSNFSKLCLTLDSIINQTSKLFEIVITDDGSKKFDKESILTYFQKNEFSNFQIIENKQNIGTVKNIQNAYRKANGEYLYAFGPGDLLYSSTSIEKFIDYLDKEKPNFGYTRFQSYSIENNKIILNDFQSPPERVINKYKDTKLALKYMILYNTYCCGATLYFKRDFIIQDKYILNNAKYCEDLIQVLIAMNDENIFFYKEKFLYYEFGCGISTNKKTSVLILNDHYTFYNNIIANNEGTLFNRKKLALKISKKNFLIRKILRLILFPDFYLFLLLNYLTTKFNKKNIKKIYEYNNYNSFWKINYDNQ